MNKDEIIAMLRASCDKDKVDPEQNGFWVIVTKELETFAKLVAQHEREACEALCKWRTGVQQVDAAIDTCAAAIPARGQA